jgi:hypothetical protein
MAMAKARAKERDHDDDTGPTIRGKEAAVGEQERECDLRVTVRTSVAVDFST